MDPITLFAMANAAVAAVKKGCQLYKDIKGAAGDVKGVLKDLDDQFHKAHKDKPPTVEQKNALVEEKNRVIELNKKGGETDDVYTEIGEQLGTYFDAYFKCKTVLIEEEKHSKEELYTGGESLAKRALQRVLMKKKLEQMYTDLRETVVYQSPPELGALWTDVNEMMERLAEEQKVHIQKKMRADAVEAKRKSQRMEIYRQEIMVGIIVFISSIAFGLCIDFIIQDRIKRYPELGTSWIPRVSDDYKAARDERKHLKMIDIIQRHQDELDKY